jgi:hypothetical protein
MGGRGREGEPIEWTGWVWVWKLETEANPGFIDSDPTTERAQACGSHWSPGRQEKPLERAISARTANRHR